MDKTPSEEGIPLLPHTPVGAAATLETMMNMVASKSTVMLSIRNFLFIFISYLSIIRSFSICVKERLSTHHLGFMELVANIIHCPPSRRLSSSYLIFAAAQHFMLHC